MSKSSSFAAESNLKTEFLKKFVIYFVVSLIFCLISFFNQNESNKYIIKTLELNGSTREGNALFKINCVIFRWITARELLGPDLYSTTQHFNDKEIIKQVTGGFTPPMPSCEIDPENMSKFIKMYV